MSEKSWDDVKDEGFEIEEDELQAFFDRFKDISPLLLSQETTVLVQRFKRTFKPISYNLYNVSYEELHSWVNEVIMERASFLLEDMVRKGEAEVIFDKDLNDFVYKGIKKP